MSNLVYGTKLPWVVIHVYESGFVGICDFIDQESALSFIKEVQNISENPDYVKLIHMKGCDEHCFEMPFEVR